MTRSTTLREMEEEREFLLRSIADLDREHAADDLAEADYQRLRDTYTARAAAVLRRLEAARAGGEAAEPAVTEQGAAAATETGSDEIASDRPDLNGSSVQVARRPSRRLGLPRRVASGRRRRGLIVIAILCFVVAAGALVVTRANHRLPGQTASGTVTLADDQRLAQELGQARVLASQGRDLEAIKLYDKVLAAQPRQPEALAYRGWLVRLAGVAGHDPALLAQGRTAVSQAVAVDPTYPDARAFLGYILFQDAHDAAGAVDQFRAFLADHPQTQMVDLTKDVVAQAFAAVGQPVPPASSPPGP